MRIQNSEFRSQNSESVEEAREGVGRKVGQGGNGHVGGEGRAICGGLLCLAIPARRAASMPAGASSTTMDCAGAEPRRDGGGEEHLRVGLAERDVFGRDDGLEEGPRPMTASTASTFSRGAEDAMA